MKEVELLYTYSTKLINHFSRLLIWYTGKDYSHIVRRKSVGNQKIIYHAAEGKVHYVNEETFLSKNKIVKIQKIQIPLEIYNKMEEESWKQVGKPYGGLQNVGILIVDLLSKLGIRATNPYKKGLNCSELIHQTVLSKLIPDLRRRKDLIKPHHIEEIVDNYNLKSIDRD